MYLRGYLSWGSLEFRRIGVKMPLDDLNEEQRRVAESLEGIYAFDIYR